MIAIADPAFAAPELLRRARPLRRSGDLKRWTA
jgi:hypothetical protein